MLLHFFGKFLGNVLINIFLNSCGNSFKNFSDFSQILLIIFYGIRNWKELQLSSSTSGCKDWKNQHRSADQTTHIIPRGPLDEKFFMPARIEPTLRGTGNCRTTVVAYRFKPIQKRHIKIALIFLFIQHQFGNPWALLQPCTNQPAIDKE